MHDWVCIMYDWKTGTMMRIRHGHRWQSSGSSKDDKDSKDTLYGIDMMLFNDNNKMQSVVTFRQPSKSEMAEMVR